MAYRKASPLRQRLPYKGSWREAPERLYEGEPDRHASASPFGRGVCEADGEGKDAGEELSSKVTERLNLRERA